VSGPDTGTPDRPRKSLGTPSGSRRSAAADQPTIGTPRSSRSFLFGANPTASSTDLKSQALDEWEAKLLGKKGEIKRQILVLRHC